jgi:hypothetical protein
VNVVRGQLSHPEAVKGRAFPTAVNVVNVVNFFYREQKKWYYGATAW